MTAKFRKHSWLLALLLIPVIVMGVGGSFLLAQEDAVTLAKMDAEQHTSKILWFAAGFFLNIFGWILAYFITPTPPASRLVGKSPEWVAVYSDAYKEKAKSIQTKYALYGCLLNTALQTGIAAITLLPSLLSATTAAGAGYSYGY